jgi:hypothetical protein
VSDRAGLTYRNGDKSVTQLLILIGDKDFYRVSIGMLIHVNHRMQKKESVMKKFNRHAWKRRVTALFTFAVMCSTPPLLAGDITEYANSDWLLAGYVWGTTEIVGSKPADPDGSGCASNDYSVQADNPPWTFEVGPNGALLTVVDNWALTELYHIYDNDIFIGDTSDPPYPLSEETCYADPEYCLESNASKGFFELSQGNHSITMTVTNYHPTFLAGCLYFRIDGDIVGAVLEVDIDVQPKSTKNNVRLNTNNLLPVAIMGSTAYDISQVDPGSVTFEGASPVRPAKFKDLNGDGMPDMMFKFAIQEISIECGDTEATLSGQTWDGQDVTGTDTINTVRCE